MAVGSSSAATVREIEEVEGGRVAVSGEVVVLREGKRRKGEGGGVAGTIVVREEKRRRTRWGRCQG